ncbi:MAG: DUF1273 domain-containing protein [Oscillospiraceae bacterium]|nr:DUF1273 domain-containing protein [Oscillospiraceae bacterium]
MTNITCCFTGHRKLPKDKTEKIQNRLELEIVSLIRQGVVFFRNGGGAGFDLMAASAVIKARERNPAVKLIMVLPCRDQPERWYDKKIYDHILKQADEIVYASDKYHNGCMRVRNRSLVNQSRYCVCYLVKPAGGTFYTVNYAMKKNLKIINTAWGIE